MGDQSVPYKLLKRIMVTCAANEYRHISLAVSQMLLEALPEAPSDSGQVAETVAAIQSGLNNRQGH